MPTIQESHDLLERNFSYIAPKPESVPKFQRIRETAKALAMVITSEVPDCRERSVAITHLETAVFWANAGLARNQ